MTKEDKWSLLLVVAALAYFGAHVAWALAQPWVKVAMSALPK